MADKPTRPTPSQPPTTFDSTRAFQVPLNMSSSRSPTSPAMPQTVGSCHNNMQPHTASLPQDAPKKALHISNLMSPPEPLLLENFSQGQQHHVPPPSRTHQAREAIKPSMPMSPPVSPYVPESADLSVPDTPVGMAKDPILYPREDISSSPAQPPLFPTTETIEHQRIVDEHIVTRPPGLFREASPPQREDYELALEFKSQVMKLFVGNRKKWFEKEREQVRADRRLNSVRWNSGMRYQTIAPAKPAPAKATRPASTRPRAIATHTNPRPDRVSKPQAARTVRSSPPTRHARRVSATPDPARRGVAPNREDRDFAALADYCPPVSSLPDRPNSLKSEWKGPPIDLSNDPNIKLLHGDEASLAANLRLDCATYLTSKRRIFIRRLECARTGKEFRKTDAQQACKIDVNKASKLWIAYDKVGWLDPKWMSQFI
ncbi:SWIRM domain-containing protein [Colletotrichum musicola]|uniref:SWIRM domain-containing protein n=1 Tax=Colletotrichum musicola TaxID=2175873 RepID=A0A8H6KHD2_9PEZI|nr:SWIRM domain-containing protein [Colletotrichum musicola]